MAETSTMASQSAPSSPRRPSLDNIEPSVTERIERYIKQANQHISQITTFADTDDEEFNNFSDAMREANSLNTNLSVPSPVSNFSFDETRSEVKVSRFHNTSPCFIVVK